ncbi:MAG TPA: hypothetical protein VIH46_08835 [Candidatus Acidoferrales bacterium]
MTLRQPEMKVTRETSYRVGTVSKVRFQPPVNRTKSLRARREVLD